MPKTKRAKFVEEEEPLKNIPCKKRKVEVASVLESRKPAAEPREAASPARRGRGRPKKSVATATNTFRVKIDSRPATRKKAGQPKTPISSARVDEVANVSENASDADASLECQIEGEVRAAKRVDWKKSAVLQKRAMTTKRARVAPKSGPVDTDEKRVSIVVETSEPAAATVAIKPRGRPQRKKKSLITSFAEAGAAPTPSRKRGRPSKKSAGSGSAPKPAGRAVGKRKGQKSVQTNNASDLAEERNTS